MVVGDILDVINNTFNDVWPASYLQLMVVGGFHVPQRIKCRHVHRCLFAWNSDISVFYHVLSDDGLCQLLGFRWLKKLFLWWWWGRCTEKHGHPLLFSCHAFSDLTIGSHVQSYKVRCLSLTQYLPPLTTFFLDHGTLLLLFPFSYIACPL